MYPKAEPLIIPNCVLYCDFIQSNAITIRVAVYFKTSMFLDQDERLGKYWNIYSMDVILYEVYFS